jgi:hypothetical protein
LFEILAPCGGWIHRAPGLLVSGYPQLAKAAASMPFGMYPSAMADPAPPSAPVDAGEMVNELDLDSMLIGHRPMPMREAVATRFAAAFDVADRKLEAVTNRGNLAPKEAWPSAAGTERFFSKPVVVSGARR